MHNPNADKLMALNDYSTLIRFVETPDPHYPYSTEELKEKVIQMANWMKQNTYIYRNTTKYEAYAACITATGQLMALVKGSYYPEMYKIITGTVHDFELGQKYGSVDRLTYRTVVDAVTNFNKRFPQYKIVSFSSAIKKED